MVQHFAPSRGVVGAALLAFPTLAASSELLLQGYRLEEVSRDTSPFLGNGVVIHEGNHLHDPCVDYISGERFTLAFTETGNNGEGRGFIVVNDCQVVQCTKWTTTSDAEWGTTERGSTILYNLVSNEDDNSESVTTTITEKWNVLEAGSCSYVGKFFHTDEDDGDCEVNGTPGSISCTGSESSVSGIGSLDTVDKVGISIGTIVGAALLALLVLYFLCCRKKNKEGSSVTTEEYDEERGDHSKTSSRWKLFGGGAKNEKESAVVEARKVASKDDEKGWRSSLFGKNTKKAAVEPPQEKKGWRSSMFGQSKTEIIPEVEEKPTKWGFLGGSGTMSKESSGTSFTKSKSTEKKQTAEPKTWQKEKQASSNTSKAAANKKETVEDTTTKAVDCTCCGI